MDAIWPSSTLRPKNDREHESLKPLSSNLRSNVTSEIIWTYNDLRGLQDGMGNMHMDIWVMGISDFKTNVKFNL